MHAPSVYTIMENTLSNKANRLPLLPGVYLMRNADGEIIYVGKAKKLKNRVTSYFRGEHLPKVAAMISKVSDFEVIVTSSEFEALCLENALIKQHMPFYNILLRDDKGYPFIRLSNDEYPRFSVVNKIAEDGAEYFGPFGGRSVSFDIISTIQKTLGLSSCSKRFPRDKGKERPCLNYQMGICSGHCLNDTPKSEYLSQIESAKLILKGKTKDLLDDLREKMKSCSEELQFEKAAFYRDKIRAIESLSNKQRLISTKLPDTDVFGFYRDDTSCFAVLHFSDGSLTGKEYELLPEPLEEDSEAIAAFMLRYYSSIGRAVPKLILLPFQPDNTDALKQYLADYSGKNCEILSPQRGDKAQLVKTANLNANEECLRRKERTQKINAGQKLLGEALSLALAPQRIEAFDISNFGNDGIVAAMTVFKNGKPLKRDYRKFKIKSTTTPDDYLSMYEAVSRRFSRAVGGEEGFDEFPDLLLIDGGMGQAACAEKALSELNIALPVYGMVKDYKHRTRALIDSDGNEVGLTGNQLLFAFVGNIQEETHRFAIEYNRTLREKNITSELDNIPGIGKARRIMLLKEFGSIKKIKEATLQELKQYVPENVAMNIISYFEDMEK